MNLGVDEALTSGPWARCSGRAQCDPYLGLVLSVSFLVPGRQRVSGLGDQNVVIPQFTYSLHLQSTRNKFGDGLKGGWKVDHY